METVTVELVSERGDSYCPEYVTEGSAGADLRAFIPAPRLLRSGSRMLVPTGIRIALPEGFEAQIRSRSGLAAREGIVVLNSPGTIDSDYRGEIQVILQNHGSMDYLIQPDERIAQVLVAPVCRAFFCIRDVLDDTVRGHGGMGSTGKV